MTVFTGIAVFLIIWWVVLFTVLPWGIRTLDRPEVAGQDPGAPVNPQLWRKIAITTAIALLLWSGFFAIHYFDLFSFRGP